MVWIAKFYIAFYAQGQGIVALSAKDC